MKYLSLLAIPFFLLLVVSSCSKEEEVIEHTLTITPTQQEINLGSGSFTINVLCDTEWTVSMWNNNNASNIGNISGLSVSTYSGSGNGSVVVSYGSFKKRGSSDQLDYCPREQASVTISCKSDNRDAKGGGVKTASCQIFRETDY